MPLTDTQIRNVKASGTVQKLSDGEGLFLRVSVATASGKASKLWQMAYRFAGKQKTLSFGPYPAVSLLQAREKRQDAKKLLAQGTDPSQQKREDKLTAKTAHANTFGAVADEFIAKMEKEGKSDKTLARARRMVALARPTLGHRPIAEIKASEILPLLQKEQAKGNSENPQRLREAISGIFRLAVTTLRAEYDPTTNLRGALTSVPVKHRAALTERESYAGLVKAIWAYEGRLPSIRTALILMVYLYPRPSELRLAEWGEFDLTKAIWVTPAHRAKTRRDHVKPLPRQVVEILKPLQEKSGLVFPGAMVGKALSENTFNSVLALLGYGKERATAHGFRASASTMLNESGLWNHDAIEAELAHVDKNEVRRAYNRGAYWEERVRMAQWWADEVDKMRAAN
ncbi:tyrosine-type recombinase/integrase [Mesorhizobium denitrificans]|uniref:DUF4102 domain-containing protein n=1 Tax=Mesorhizobium denitrificans TaxID=2294114 RepID=A0A371XDX5_9HYPH|nr:integrase arm-type DNA-binding domain-containing protein [Mesorhizobium denitrificans]RFC67412.1 DUF4102 domain-containing protein [Mesorhizobium denitrificans]